MPVWKPPTALDVINKRRAERMYREGGWGPQLTYTVARGDGKPLFVQLRMPQNVEFVERGESAPPIVFAGSLVADASELASFRVEFVEGRVPSAEAFPDPGEPWVHQEVTKLSDKAIQVMRVNNDPRLQLIYALESQFGELKFVFDTTNEGMLGPKARDTYRKIVETTWIGTKKRPY